MRRHLIAAAAAFALAACGVGPEVGPFACDAHRAGVLPDTRNRTYGAETPVASEDLNDLQDGQIMLFGQITKHIEATYGQPLAGNGAATPWGLGPSIDANPFLTWFVGLGLPVGSKIINIRARVKDNAAGPTKLSLNVSKSLDDVQTTLGGAAVTSSGAGTWQTLPKNGLNEITVAGTSYFAYVACTAGAALASFDWIEVDYLPPRP